MLSLIVSACGSSKQSGMTPLPDSRDPKDELLFEAASKYIASQNAPTHSAYDYERVDLNGDGLREGIVLFNLPHRYWCGWDGCGMVVFKANTKGFTPMATMSGVRGPIYVDNTGNMGWRDIIIRTSGTKLRDKNVVMRYNGKSYPNSPMLVPTYKGKISQFKGDRLFR